MNLADIIRQFKSPAFIATVLDEGDTLQAAIDASYSHVVGATTDRRAYDYCAARFQGVSNVRLFYGEEIILHEVIKDINVQCTFCLDSRSEPTPALIQELGVLKHHRIKSHVILVKNEHLFGTEESGWITQYQVEQAIRQINIGYRFREVANTLIATYP